MTRRHGPGIPPEAIDAALGALAGLIAHRGRTGALPIFARLEAEAAARDDLAAVMARARARAGARAGRNGP